MKYIFKTTGKLIEVEGGDQQTFRQILPSQAFRLGGRETTSKFQQLMGHCLAPNHPYLIASNGD